MQWKELAEVFSHQPNCLEYDGNGNLKHNGIERGTHILSMNPSRWGKISINIQELCCIKIWNF